MLHSNQNTVTAFAHADRPWPQAALEAFPNRENDLTPCQHIEDVFLAVQHSEAYRGVVPFENSSNGAVIMTLDLFADIDKRCPDVIVAGEVYIDVHHCLIGRHSSTLSVETPQKNVAESLMSSGGVTPTAKIPHPTIPRTSPSKSLGHIKKLYSHPQAWGQCKTFLAAYLKGVERQDVSSTSRAAEIVAQDTSGTAAAISSEIAAKFHGLEMLAKGIEDREDNTTRFLILRRNVAGTHLDEAEANAESIQYKSLLSFMVPHFYDPGALAAALAIFQNHHLNLTSINTRPSGLAPWNYIFFIEFQGRRLQGEKGEVNHALRDLGGFVEAWRWLGSWQSKSSHVKKTI